MDPKRTNRNNNPEGIQKHKIPVEVVILRPRVLVAIDVEVKRARAVVQDIAVQLARGDDDLQRVSERVLGDDEDGEQEGERAPGPGGDVLHDHVKGVGGEVSRVREGVFLPELREEVLRAGEGGPVQGVVALEDEVDGAACFCSL